MRNWIIAIALLGAALPAWAGEHVPPVTSEVVKKECGSCHMAFQPQFLPRESWRKIMDRLPRHFGSKVTLSEAARRDVETYHLENAADVSHTREGKNYLTSIGKGTAPLRITHVPHWVAHHRNAVDKALEADTRIKSKSDCLACHREADTGWYQGN
jgi:hypothetical protein